MFDLISDPHLLRPPPPRADARSRRCLSVSLSPCLASPWKMRLETIYAFSTPFLSFPPSALSPDRPRLIDLSVRRRFVVFSFSTSRQTGPDRRRRYKELDSGGRWVRGWMEGQDQQCLGAVTFKRPGVTEINHENSIYFFSSPPNPEVY